MVKKNLTCVVNLVP